MNKLCMLPWTHMATLTNGDVKLCCIAKNDSGHNLNNEKIVSVWNSDYYKKVRKEMLDGKEISTCQVCYDEEELGVTSHRQFVEQAYKEKNVVNKIKQLIDSTAEDGSIEITPPTLDLRLGNTCNLECIMCGPGESSKWNKRAELLANTLETDIKRHWIFVAQQETRVFDWYRSQSFLDSIVDIAPSLLHITFGGGEPLYIKEHKQLIQKLVELDYAKNIELLYHTNGTIYDQEVVDLWSKFKSIKVMLSIDGLGEVNDIIRRPSNWSQIEKNLRLYDLTEDNIVVSINLTAQLLNASNLVDFAQWLLDQNFKKIGKRTDGGIYFASLLHFPEYLSIQVLPKNKKQEIKKTILDFVKKYPANKGIQRLLDVVDFMNACEKESLLYKTKDFLDKNKIDNLFSAQILNNSLNISPVKS